MAVHPPKIEIASGNEREAGQRGERAAPAGELRERSEHVSGCKREEREARAPKAREVWGTPFHFKP